MKIWHVGASPTLNAVNGLNSAVWLLAKGQAQLGHKVAVVLNSQPDKSAIALAKESSIELINIPTTRWRYEPSILKQLLDSSPPQIVHMHNVFLPKHALLALELVRKKIPYVITPHGGLMRSAFNRGWLKKYIYSRLIEKRRFCTSSAIVVVTPGEEKDVRTFVPNYKGTIRWIPNPVDINSFEGQSWKGNISEKRVIFLGRFDVLHKGIDILVDIAHLLPDVEFHLYGSDPGKTKNWFEKLKRNSPINVHFHKPVFGSEKAKVLANASLYIQTSRWDGFPCSVAEAMYLGLPCAITKKPKYAKLFRQYNLGLLLSMDPKQAAVSLRKVLAKPKPLLDFSKRAKTFALNHFHPRKVALDYLKFYEEVILS